MNYGHSTPSVGTAGADHGYVEILNEAWPPLEVARRLNDRPGSEQIPVVVRLAFVTGEEWVPGTATRWQNPHRQVRVVVNDARVMTGGVWVDADDIRRP